MFPDSPSRDRHVRNLVKKILIRKFSLYLVHECEQATRYLLLSPIIATPRKQHTRAILNIEVHKHILIACFSYHCFCAPLSISRALISTFHYSFTLYFTPHTRLPLLIVLEGSSHNFHISTKHGTRAVYFRFHLCPNEAN